MNVTKILHVLKKLDIGGMEVWLLDVLRFIDRQRFAIDILVHSPDKGYLEDRAVSLGARILRIPYPTFPWRYGSNFKRVLREYGPYQVIHSHPALSGFLLRWAQQSGIPVRIAHSHSDENRRLREATPQRRLLLKFSNYFINHYATVGLAGSGEAASGRFGFDWADDARFQVLPCGINLVKYNGPVDRLSVRRSLGVPESAFVLGYVGRFRPEKNHSFLLEIAAQVRLRLPETYLLLVGDGPLRSSVEGKVRSLDLSKHVVFTGFRDDVAEILLSAVDLFVLPSQRESQSMVLIEAQSAGLPCLIADTIPEEVVVIPELVRRISLADGPQVWAEAVLAAKKNLRAIKPLEAVKHMRHTLFNIETNVRHVEYIYETGIIPRT